VGSGDLAFISKSKNILILLKEIEQKVGNSLDGSSTNDFSQMFNFIKSNVVVDLEKSVIIYLLVELGVWVLTESLDYGRSVCYLLESVLIKHVDELDSCGNGGIQKESR